MDDRPPLPPGYAAERALHDRQAELRWIDDILDANEVPDFEKDNTDGNRRQRILWLLDLKDRARTVEGKLRQIRGIAAG